MMKSLITTGIVLLSLAGASLAQNKSTYTDDIYYNPNDSKKEYVEDEVEQSQRITARESRNNASDNSDSYFQEGEELDNRSRMRSYEDDNYGSIDDEYYYSTQINRFNYPFYNRPYWSSFYNPYWYDPFWVDPYWGWSPWARPGLSMGFGAGPYWSSYWGWQSWYGYGGFNSFWAGGMNGFGGGYYSGFWNGYYAGFYGNNGLYGGGGYRGVSYGPRYSLHAPRNNSVNTGRSNSGFRRESMNNQQRTLQSGMEGPRNSNLRMGDNSMRNRGTGRDAGDRAVNVRDIDGSRIAPIDRNAPIRSSDGSMINDRGARTFGSGRQNNSDAVPERRLNQNGAIPQGGMTSPAQPRQSRGGIFGGRGSNPSRMEQPRMQQSAPSQPRMQQQSSPAPRMSTPSRSFGSGGSRSFGGSGSGGGSMRGGGGGRR